MHKLYLYTQVKLKAFYGILMNTVVFVRDLSAFIINSKSSQISEFCY